MPVSYTIHPEHRVVATRFVDPVSDEDFYQLYRSIFADAGYRIGMCELADLRDAPHLNVSRGALRRVKELTEAVYRDGAEGFRTAIFAPYDLAFAVGRVYEAFMSGGPEQVRVSRSLEEALAWLGRTGLDEATLHGPSGG